MPRRKAYSKLTKFDRYRPKHVRGQTLYKVFQCLNPDCTAMITVRTDDIDIEGYYSVQCPQCGYEFHSGGAEHLFDYSMDVDDKDEKPISVANGKFEMLHDEYIDKAPLYKYCVMCNALQPIENFDYHDTKKSGRQSECRICKKHYNAIKNGTRKPDQHFEAAQKRRLLVNVAGEARVDRAEIEEKYDYRCFCCGADLRKAKTNKQKPIDHTLPARYLWPATTDSGTLLCRDCNGQKSGKWPSAFYNDAQIHKLALYTGFEYHLLTGEPCYNPKALEKLQTPEYVDELLEKCAAYMDEVCKLRNRILDDTGIDFFQYASALSRDWFDYADSLRR